MINVKVCSRYILTDGKAYIQHIYHSILFNALELNYLQRSKTSTPIRAQHGHGTTEGTIAPIQKHGYTFTQRSESDACGACLGLGGALISQTFAD